MQKFMCMATVAFALSSASGLAGAGLLGHHITCAGGGASSIYGLACSQASTVVGAGVEFNLGHGMTIDFDDSGFLLTAPTSIAGLGPRFEFADLTQAFASVTVTQISIGFPPLAPSLSVVDGILRLSDLGFTASGSWRGDITLAAPPVSVPEPEAPVLLALAAGVAFLSASRRRA